MSIHDNPFIPVPRRESGPGFSQARAVHSRPAPGAAVEDPSESLRIFPSRMTWR